MAVTNSTPPLAKCNSQKIDLDNAINDYVAKWKNNSFKDPSASIFTDGTKIDKPPKDTRGVMGILLGISAPKADGKISTEEITNHLAEKYKQPKNYIKYKIQAKKIGLIK